MAYNPYTDPQRAARQAAQQAAEAARQASKRSMDASQAAAKLARENAQRVFDQNSKRARDNFIRQTQQGAGTGPGFFRKGRPADGDSTGFRIEPKRSRLGRFIGFLALLALIYLVGSRLLGW